MANSNVGQKTESGMRTIDWSAAIWASIIAGLVFAALEMALAWLVHGESPWAPLHMIGAIGLGQGALTPPDTFDLKIVGTAVVIHIVLAIVYGVILALIIARMSMGTAVIAGAVYGLVLYCINFYGFSAIFPGFADARGWVSILTHVVQSALMAYLYKVFATGKPAVA
ncbi:MAG TPA: hypothetical protein VJQ49_07380 [Casimicrobiaceae bacterium]|nr:hypothetical protein [Casimicrobiaceae bacterium]